MSNISAAIAELEQELEVSQLRCADLARAIETLRPLSGEGNTRGASRTKKPLRNERTNERTKQGPGRRAVRSLPDVTSKSATKSAAILAMLKKHGGSMSPGELAAALNLKRPTLSYQPTPLIKAKQVVVTGATAGRRVSLPGSAKEGL